VKIDEPDTPNAPVSVPWPTHHTIRANPTRRKASHAPNRTIIPSGPTRPMTLSLAS
jgi:hypothetical protein